MQSGRIKRKRGVRNGIQNDACPCSYRQARTEGRRGRSSISGKAAFLQGGTRVKSVIYTDKSWVPELVTPYVSNRDIVHLNRC